MQAYATLSGNLFPEFDNTLDEIHNQGISVVSNFVLL